MILRDPITLTWLLITVLILAFSGELFVVADNHAERTCTERSLQLVMEHRHGPLEACQGVY